MVCDFGIKNPLHFSMQGILFSLRTKFLELVGQAQLEGLATDVAHL